MLKHWLTEAESHWNEYDQMDVWVKLNERKKSEELRELLGLEPVSLMIKWVGWDGLDMLNEKMIMTGSNVV